MATPGRPIDTETNRRIVRLAESSVPTKRIARMVGVCPQTARKYVRLRMNRPVGSPKMDREQQG